MRDCGTELRRAFWLALDGMLTVDGNDVPVYNGKVEDSITSNVYVLFQETSSKPVKNKSMEASEVYLTMDIKQRIPSSVSSEDIEDVADQILQIVKPTTKTIGITIANPFKIIILAVEDNDNERPREVESNSFMVTKSLRFRNHIIKN